MKFTVELRQNGGGKDFYNDTRFAVWIDKRKVTHQADVVQVMDIIEEEIRRLCLV